MTVPTPVRIRLGAAALAVAGPLFLLYPATRPWHDESTVEGARQSLGSDWWVASHLFAMIGFILIPLGLLAVSSVVGRTLAFAAFVTTWIGVGLVLPYYGAEDFGLHGVAAAGKLDLDLVDAIRFGAVAATTFGVGLILLGVGAALAAVAIWRSGALPRFSGVLFAAGLVLFLPQFYTPPAVRIGHGVLMAVGLLWLAAALWRAGPPASR